MTHQFTLNMIDEIAHKPNYQAATNGLKVNIPLLGVVENMSYYHCPNCAHESYPFGQQGGGRLADEYHINLLAKIPLMR